VVENLTLPPPAVSPTTGSKRKRDLGEWVQHGSEEMQRRCDPYASEPYAAVRLRKRLRHHAENASDLPSSHKEGGSKPRKAGTPPSGPPERRTSNRLKKKGQLVKVEVKPQAVSLTSKSRSKAGKGKDSKRK
jgi:hypothetical protein